MRVKTLLALTAVLCGGCKVVTAQAAYHLGYAAESCDDLRPTRVPFIQDMIGQPGFAQGGMPPNNPQQIGFNNQLPPNAGVGGFNRPLGPGPDGMAGLGQPILMTTLSPYRIMTSENRYKRGKIMEVRLEGREFFEAFIIEARALGGGPSNKLPQAGVGRFVGAPRTTMFLNCRDRSSSAVVNAPTPVRMNNLTFTWEAPFQDVGDIYFIASALLGDRYWIFTSDRMVSNPFPGELVGCGIRRTCVRLCGYYHTSPVCSLDEAEYVLIIEIDPTGREAQFTLGGRIRNPETYVAFGMANSDFSLTDMDMAVCMVERGRVSLGHYFVKQEMLPPFPHAGVLIPDLTDMDSEYVWCRYRRPLLPFGPTAVNPAIPTFHYYFKGHKNESGVFLPRSIYTMNISPYKRNITEFYTDVQTSNRGTGPVNVNVFLPLAVLLLKFTF